MKPAFSTIGGAGSSLGAASSRRARFPDELLDELFEFLETPDVLSLADAQLDCVFYLKEAREHEPIARLGASPLRGSASTC